MNPFEGMKGLTKNPLGILAVFLGVLYGVAGLLLGVDSKPLTDSNQTIITWLVFTFPFVSLFVFAWLVAKHHTKLYGPRDYRSDKSFLGSIQTTTPEEQQQKLDQEAEALQLEPPATDETGAEVADADIKVRLEPTTKTSESLVDRRRQIFAAESKILNLLDQEFDELKRQVKLISRSGRSILIDAVARKGKEITLIEIVVAKYDHTVTMRARDVATQFLSIAPTFPDDLTMSYIMCVVWLEGEPADAERGVSRARRTFEDLGLSSLKIRQFSFPDLRIDPTELPS